MSRFDALTKTIKQYPLPDPIINLRVDSSGDLCFDLNKLIKDTASYDDETYMIDDVEKYRNTVLDATHGGKLSYRHDVASTIDNIVSGTVMPKLVNTLEKALDMAKPKRAEIYKWFNRYIPETTTEIELALAVYDYVIDNHECQVRGSKHAKAYIALVHRMREKHGKAR